MALTYEYQCPECGCIVTAIRAIEDRANGPDHCGVKTRKVIATAPQGYVDNMEEYRCPVTNQGVTTRRQRNDIMAREGLVDANDFLKSDEDRKKQSDEAAAQRKKFENSEPKEVRNQVNDWARKQIAL